MDILGMLGGANASPRAKDRPWWYNIGDNVIGFDDAVVTPGERAGAGIGDTLNMLRDDPLGTVAGVGGAVLDDMNYLMFEGGAEREPHRVMDYAMGVTAPGAAVGRYSPNVVSAGGVKDTVHNKNIMEALKVEPDLEDLLPLIHPEEMKGITPRTAAQLMQTYKAVDQPALEAAALAGDAKRGWYTQSAEAIQHVFGEDTPRFTALLSALSPQTSVEANLSNALNVWKNWTAAGRPTSKDDIVRIMGRSVQGSGGDSSVLDAWVNNSVRALSEPTSEMARLSGPKVDSFAPNTAGDLSRLTLDTHAADLTGFDQNAFSQSGSGKARETNVAGFGPNYIGAAAAHRNVAQTMTDKYGLPIEPANVQEASWSFAKPLKDLYKSRNTPMRSLLEEGALTDDLVRGTPDFATLLQEADYANPLKEAGYGQKLDTLRPPTDVARIGASPDPDALARATSTLQHAVDRNRVIGATAPYRTGAGDANKLGYRRAGRGGVELGTGDVAGIQLAPDEGFAKALDAVGYDAPPMVLANKSNAPQLAAQAADYHTQLPDWLRGMVDLPDAAAYRNARTIVTDGGTVMVKPSGEIGGLMKAQKGGPRGFAQSALHAATQNGGTWLNAYDTVLPQTYAQAGFRPVARVKFDPQYTPEGWDAAKLQKLYNTSEPDIVFMVYDPKFKGKVTRGVGGKVFTDYDEAAKYTQGLAGKKRK